MRTPRLLILIAFSQTLVPARLPAQSPAQLPAQDWTHFVRIGGYGLSLDRVDTIVQNAQQSHVFGIETDNDVPGRYESFLDPSAKLQAIRAVAEKAHAAGNYAFVYIAGLECITANADRVPHTMFKDHPDWIQRNLHGDPAVFGGGTAFWIRSGDEDVWISPFAPEWRKVYMERVRQIAATGIDGIYVDIPYWMTHFDNWEQTWASFDDYTVAAFKQKTGLDARQDVKLGDYNDPAFIRWIDFRIQAITDFMAEIDHNIKSVNPRCKTIAEIYPGIEESAPRVGSDVYELYPVIDAICHEYEYGEGNHLAASRTPLDWFGYMTGMLAFRAFAGSKPTWILNYSWENQNRIEPREAMENLFVSELMAGANIYDARGHVMSGSNDIATRTRVFDWIARHEKTFYSHREPIQPIGVYFSPHTRDYFPREFVRSFRGVMFLLLQSHREFQVVTPRTLRDFSGRLLILPDVKCLSRDEVEWLGSFVRSGNTLMLTGETGKFDERRRAQAENPLLKLLGITDPSRKQTGASPLKFIYAPECPGRTYYAALEKELNDYAVKGDYRQARFNQLREGFLQQIDAASGSKAAVEIHASPFVSTQIARVNGNLHVFIANFGGLRANEVARQTPERNVSIDFRAESGAKAYALPFLGDVQELQCSSPQAGRKVCVIPEINKGTVVWLEQAH